MSSILNSQAVVLATAMAAFSGTLILFAFRHQKSIPALRPCLSSGGRNRVKRKKKKVRFAKDVVDPIGDNELFRRQYCGIKSTKNEESQNNRMPANRVALYKGILRDRVHPRMTYSY